ncbi:NAD-glutamate dehydrogenase [Natronospira bacteriovora]|uniref:NAD-glutamate dehydrogenase n=1 Tax=Natronospira bacteriovora TaxID=3069753 RepID=A0ABU0W8Y1_9GAMM|nr:NAD-glutamate dehydrogenase [Natronospira sp. AB-CW4]MDQ2070373.1 NAD-glutamate dehydrogenase [Natronospira sp. AB-CW4]
MVAKKSSARRARTPQIISAARDMLGDRFSDQHETFIRHFFRAVAREDLATRTPKDLAGAALAHWKFGRDRVPGEPSIRIYNPDRKQDGWESQHTVVEVVTDDMPFLVDSLSMALNRKGFTIHLTVHPLVQVDRTPKGRLRSAVEPGADMGDKGFVESWQQIEIDRETDEERLEDLRQELLRVLDDVRMAVEDWSEMRQKANQIRVELETDPPKTSSDIREVINFLEWMESNHFTFLGYQEYRLDHKGGHLRLLPVHKSGLGILSKEREKSEPRDLPEQVHEHALSSELLVITKANSFSTVHRPSYLDYVSIKTFDDEGNVLGERRFLGLFTSSAYSRSPRDIPILRRKVDAVIRKARLPNASHAGKALLHILETYPRDELFQSTVDELYDISTGIVQLQERQRVKLFIRRDAFGRFYSCLVYVPRERYNTQVREHIQAILKGELNGLGTESTVEIDESILARAHIIVRTQPWTTPEFSVADIEEKIEYVVRSWQDHLRDILVDRLGEEQGLKLHRRYANCFPAAYQEDVTPEAAAYDVQKMDLLQDDDSIRMSLYRPKPHLKNLLRFKIFRREQPIPISDILPMLENMGVKVIAERPYEIELGDLSIVWIQDVEMINATGEDVDLEAVREIFQDAFERTWNGDAENDGFHRLVLSAELDWRQVVILRAYCKYLSQTGLPFSQNYMEDILVGNTAITRDLVALFETAFDPDFDGDRGAGCRELAERIGNALEDVSSLDADRILRAYLGVIRATLRTNFYQQGQDGDWKSYVSFKFDPAKVPELPLPKPAYEIFLYSPRVEGVHLRGGKVARGGLRWSDRREDFRTEVLGLMKAQQVKNTLIVPMGAKGGFVVKQPPRNATREAMMAEVENCYKDFIRGLLDITDNLKDGKIVPPPACVRHDDDDPYLVVAADKGTATFSDLANAVSAEYDFWLGDAFASGGSVGYDHKKMGITAKGAWESVKRHFREMGIDCQNQDFSVVGIGDMGGDVFGNGMLLSRHIKLKAAFNHMHIFLDPDPDPEASFKERERLFKLPRSTWDDYNKELISRGGGVFSRSAKSITLPKEVREMLDVEESRMTPQELIRAILKSPVDLIWNGGIGTYVKSVDETHADVGDRANDGVRINGSALRCRVVGEGGNLGLTQLGRIEYAQRGGRINTDFIDNSGGVDCSDREVNIKILLSMVMADGGLKPKQRDKLFMDMTSEVSNQVLRDNYLQTQALSFTEAQAANRLNEHVHLIRVLERSGDLNRSLEYLPDDEGINELRKSGRGLTRPELSILLAYAKNDIYSDLLASDVPEDTYLARELSNYFPTPLRDKYQDYMEQHRLRREIIATSITNSMVNRMGPSFSQRMRDDTGADHASVTRAYTIAREAFGVRELWQAVEGLDNRVPASIQISMMVQIGRLLRNATRWLLNRPERRLDIAERVSFFQEGIATMRDGLMELLPQVEISRIGQNIQQFTDMAVPEPLARQVAVMEYLYSGLDLVEVAHQREMDILTVAKVYFDVGSHLHLDWIREEIEALPAEGHWQSVARGTLRENLFSYRRDLTAIVLDVTEDEELPPNERADAWCAENDERVMHAMRIIGDMQNVGGLDFATVSVALQEIRKLAQVEHA